MTDVPLHVQVIELLERKVEERRAKHREKAGNGLPDQDYQRMVGRIHEGTAILELFDRLKRSGLENLEDDEEDEETQRDDRTARRQGRAR